MARSGESSATISANAEGLQCPAVARLVCRRQLRPRPISPFASNAPKRDGTHAADCRRLVGGELFDEAKDVALRQPADPHRDDSLLFVLRIGQSLDPPLGLPRQHARGPGEPRLEPGIDG